MVIWFSSKRIPCCRFLPSSSLRLSPSIQQQSWLQDCSPIPMFQLPASVDTCGHVFQVGVCRAVARIVCVGCHSIQTVPDELLHSPRAQMLPPLSQTIAPIWGSHSHFSSPTPWLQVQSCSLFLFLPSFLPVSYYYMDLYIHFQLSETSSSSHLFCEISYT